MTKHNLTRMSVILTTGRIYYKKRFFITLRFIQNDKKQPYSYECHPDDRKDLFSIFGKTTPYKMQKTLGTHNYYIYIVTNKNKSVLYIGVTNNLKERLYYHQNPEPFSKHFTAKYKCFHLIYYEHYNDIETAINREKQLKGWLRSKKEDLISSFNPEWTFLNNEI